IDLAVQLVRADVEKPLRRVAKQLELVDRLSGTALAQLRWAVGAQDQQRYAGLARLDHGGQQLRDGGARGAGHRDGEPRGLRQPEREEARAALIDVRVA